MQSFIPREAPEFGFNKTQCAKGGGVRKMFDFAKTFASILSVGLDWLMFNLAPIKFQ